ncbi:MAG: amidohydrolase family protein, partial [Candidatus Aminicenantes bacterium]|nr:amidohydrolase family protein [Candidatus Aminicenantes bacterium]
TLGTGEEVMGGNMKKMKKTVHLFLIGILCLSFVCGLWGQTKSVKSGERYERLVIRNVTLIDGKGTPPRGPVDVILKNNTIESVRGAGGAERYSNEKHILDGTGLYLLPGLINIHAHVHDNRGGAPLPFGYSYKLWLACGITSVRDVGSNYEMTIEERRKSNDGQMPAPRIFLYMRAWGETSEQARLSVRNIAKQDGDGVKIFGMDRDIMEAAVSEALKLNLRVAHHVAVEETDAWDNAAFGVTSIEHWYGVPDAALKGSQNFPYWYSLGDEAERFRYAGHLWREADPKKLDQVLQILVDKQVAWCPTLVIYEANRDLVRAQNQPWFGDYLHPVLEEYFKPDPAHHGSYFWNWTTEDEVFWRQNYQIWMRAVRNFSLKGGLVGAGEDAGYIYMLYGFSLIRELELHREAGFHPIDVIQHATGNNAKILGKENELGRVRAGYLADLILVEGNPLKNLKYLYPTGVMEMVEGEMVKKGGVQWTIKDGYVYNAPMLLEDVKEMVAEARKKKTP